MNTDDELRAMLDERGVNWDYGITGAATTKFRANGVDLTFMSMRDGLVCTTILTPAQAIAATLGSDDTYTREDVESAFVSGYSLGLDMFDSSKTDKGWNQNERNLDEEMEDLGWVRKDAATPDAGTCEADETDLIPFVRADSGDLVRSLNDERDQLADENAQLRDLVHGFAIYRHFDCQHCGYREQCKAGQTNCYKAYVDLIKRAKEFGIEVDA